MGDDGDIGARGAGAIGVPGRTPSGGAAGRGIPGLSDVAEEDAEGAAAAGNGWRGPERTWPGRGGTAVVGIGRGGGGVGRPGARGGGSVDGGRGTGGAAGNGALGAPTGGCSGAPRLRIGGRKAI